jgi:CPA1 family monovalent cation:H+ antiporter
MTVLKGESLINDAAALTLVAAAVAAVAGTPAFIDNLPLYFLYSSVVGIVLGMFIGNFAQLARRKLANPSLATAVSVLVPFAAYLIAEELHASGVLAVVAAGFALGHHSIESGYEERMQEREFWRTLDTLLETFVFAYIGLQLRFVVTDAFEAGIDLWSLFGAAAAIFLATVAIRFAWVFATSVLAHWRFKRLPDRPTQLKQYADRLAAIDVKRPGWRAKQEARGQRFPAEPPPYQHPLSWKENVVLSWTGMRGVVTLAAAAGIPVITATGEDFPGREVILALAFLVTIATLLIQGLTLPRLIKQLDLTDPRDAAFEAEQHALARTIAQTATEDVIEHYRAEHPGQQSQQLAFMMQKRLTRTAEAGAEPAFDRHAGVQLGRDLLEARRQRLIGARDAQELEDTVVRDMLEQMDLEQAFMDMNGKRMDGPKGA